MATKRNLTSLLLCLQESSNGIFFTANGNNDVFLSYRDLLKSARCILHHLIEKGIKTGDELIFQFASNANFVVTFWACQLGGIVPVPVSASKSNEVEQKLLAIWKTLQNPWIISDNTNTLASNDFINEISDSIRPRYISFREIYTNLNKLAEVKETDENSTAFIQFSSGSTGQPKGVVLTHKNLLTNLHAIDAALAPVKNSDFMCCWTPLTHDLGIIGGHIMPMYAEISQNLISTNSYLKNPSIWLQKMAQYKATISASPNFGFYYSTKHVDHAELQRIDLSSIKYILNGAEPISHDVCTTFTETFGKYGLRKNSILPVYGMAEACLAVTIPELHKPLTVYNTKRSKLNSGDKVEIIAPNNDVSFVGVGKPVKGCLLKLFHQNGDVQEDEKIGEILIKGENVTKKYYGHLDEPTNDEGWFNTGDLGFIKGRELVVTGRKKDIIFSKGQNYYPHDLERIAEQLDEIEHTKIAFAGHTNYETGMDDVLGFVLYKRDINTFTSLADKIKVLVSEKAGIAIKHIIAVRRIPKTTSGKVQRYLLIENYKNGMYNDVLRQMEKLNSRPKKRPIIPGTSDIEKQLISIWQDVLEIKPIGINDNFFELGGDSVKAIRIGAKLQELKYAFEPSLLLEKKTIQEISEYILESSIGRTDKREIIENNSPNEPDYSIANFSNDDLEDVFSKK